MRRASVAVVIACYAAAGVFAQPLPVIGLITEYKETSSTEAVAAMQTELDTIMEPLGADVQWHPARSPVTFETRAVTILVRFLGACRPTSGTSPTFVTGALAHTYWVDGHFQPIIDVNCARISEY